MREPLYAVRDAITVGDGPISYTPRDEIELADTKGDFEALWAELRGARTTDYRDRQRFRLVPRGNAQCRSTRGFQRPRALFHKSNR